MRKYLLSLAVLGALIGAHVGMVQAQTVPPISPFRYTGTTSTITTVASSSAFMVPSLGASGNPCVSIANSAGLFATSTCGGGGAGSATTSINNALGPVFNFIASSTGNALSFASSTSGGSSTIQFLLDLSSYLKAALQSLNGATSSAQTLVGGTGISASTVAGASNSTTTFTNTGVTSFTGQGCVTAANSTGTVALTVTCISGNQSITFTISGDATGTASGATSITDSITVTGLNGKALPANTTGTLQFVDNAWKINLATSSLGLYNASGTLSSFIGSSCGGGNFVTGISATGTVACSAASSSGITSINGATSTSHTDAAGAGISITTTSTASNSTTTFTNTGVTQLNAGGCVTVSATTTNVTLGSTCVTSVTGSNSIVSSGGTTPNISLVSSTASGTILIGTGSSSWAVALPTSTGPLTWTYASGSLSLGCATCLTGNQTITIVATGDATGTASGATSITHNLTITGLQGKALPAVATGTLQYIDGAWKLNNVTSSLGLYNASGTITAFAGSNCVAGSVATGISATGTVPCVTTSTILTGYSTSTGANPTATISTSTQNGSANTFMRSDGAPAFSQSLGYTFSALGNTTSTGNISASTLNVSTTAQITGTTTLSNNVFIGGTLNVTSTATFNGAINSNATATFNSSTVLSSLLNVILATDGTGKIVATTTSAGAAAQGAFGGTGSDGALNQTSTNLAIDLGGNQVVTKNYTSINISGSGSISFTSPSASGTIIVLKSQGACVVSSTASIAIDLRKLGGIGGTAGAASGAGVGEGGGGGASAVAPGTNGNSGTGGAQTAANNGQGYGSHPLFGFQTGGTGGQNLQTDPGASSTNYITSPQSTVAFWKYFVIPGSGGGGGGGVTGFTSTDGTRGGGAMYMECAGAFNFPSGSKIDASALNATSTSNSGGPGAGGGAGSVEVLAGSITSSAGTCTKTGGIGGSGFNSNFFGGNGADGYCQFLTNTDFPAGQTSGVTTVANGGTNNSSFTAGSVIFASSSSMLGENNANFFWDNAGVRLGVGTSSFIAANSVGNFVNNSTSGLQFNVMNTASSGYSDYVATMDNGTNSSGFGGFGINNSNGAKGAENNGDVFIESSSTGAGIDYETFATSTTSSTHRFFVGGNAAGNLKLTINSTSITSAEPLLFSVDNTQDIGASGANRPKNLHVAGTIDAGTMVKGDVLASNGTVFNHLAVGADGSATSTNAIVASSSATNGIAYQSIPAGWEFLGSTFLSGAAVSTTLVSFPAREQLMFEVYIAGYGGGDIGALRFNSDSATNYWDRHIAFTAAATTTTNVQTTGTTLIRLASANATLGREVTVNCSNHTGKNKLCTMNTLTDTNSTSTAGVIDIGSGEYVTSTQITSVTLITAGAQTLSASSGIMIYGKNF